jgi:hypothetical protein
MNGDFSYLKTLWSNASPLAPLTVIIAPEDITSPRVISLLWPRENQQLTKLLRYLSRASF